MLLPLHLPDFYHLSGGGCHSMFSPPALCHFYNLSSLLSPLPGMCPSFSCPSGFMMS